MIRKIDAMHCMFGKIENHKCKECEHLIRGEYNGKELKKCECYGMTHSQATDWTVNTVACGLFNKEYKGKDVIEILKHKSRKEIEPPLEGQISFI